MENSFDVIRDSWVTVKYVDNTQKKVSVREIFENAQKIERIYDSNFQYEYGILNFLLSLVYSAYPLNTLEDKIALVNKGFFDIDLFDRYITNCETKRPNCFNLFGENPFYQNSKMKKDKPSSVGKIALDIPGGNNTAHFASNLLIGKCLTFEETAKALCSYNLFQYGQDGPKSSACPNGGQNYPEYFVYHYDNLFKDLVLNIITEDTWHQMLNEDIPYTGNAAWEITKEFGEKEITKTVSLVEGLTFQNRFVLLNSVENGLVKDIYFTAGRQFKPLVEKKSSDKTKSAEDSAWRQPNGAYYHKKVKLGKGKSDESIELLKVLTLYGYNKVWKDYPVFLKDKNGGDTIATLGEYLKIKDRLNFENSDLKFFIYYSSFDGGQYPPFQMGVYENYIPLDIIEDEDKRYKFSQLFDLILNISSSIQSDITSKNLKDIFLDKVEVLILPKILIDFSSLNSSDTDFEKKLMNVCYNLAKELKFLAIQVYDENVLKGTNNTAIFKIQDKQKKEIQVGFYGKTSQEKRFMIGYINKKIKEGGFCEDDEK